jgi:5-methylthioadenosine/S-adenosylhomocysteine deaminase
MQHIDTLISASWIIPVEPRGRVFTDHTLAIDGGRIRAVLPRTQAYQAYDADNHFELTQHALIPGLVNAHTHAAMTLFRGLADDRPLMEWLAKYIWPAEARWVSDRFVRDGTELAVAEMLRSGTTCFNDMYFFPDEAARVASEAGLRAVVGLLVIDTPTVWAKDIDEYLAKATEVHDQCRNSPTITTAFAPHAPYSVSDAALARIQMLAEELDIPIHMHVHETAAEVNRSLEESGERPLDRLRRLGVLSHRLVAVHMTQLSAEEIGELAERGVHVVHCAESNLKLASGFCPVQRLMAADVNVALGTDGAASNNDLDMLGETRTAALLAKGVAGAADAVKAADALRMATLNAARALGLDATIGSIEVGKSADITALDLGAPETQPLYDPVSQIVYACTRDQVAHVWVAGRHVLNERKLTTIDEQRLQGIADTWRERLQES